MRFEARRRGVPMAEVVREAVERHLPGATPGTPLSFFAIGTGGPPDASEHVDDLREGSHGHTNQAATPSLMLVVDAGPLVAAAATRDRNHQRCVELLS